MGDSPRQRMARPSRPASAVEVRSPRAAGRLAPRLVLAFAVTVAVAGVSVVANGGRASQAPIASTHPLQSPVVSAAAEAVTPSVRPVPGHELYAFVPYWEMDATIAAHVVDADVSTVGLFSVTSTSTGAVDTTQKGYRRIAGPIARRIIADAHARHRRVDVTYTSFGADRNSRLFGDPVLQDRVIASLVELTSSLGTDGVAVNAVTAAWAMASSSCAVCAPLTPMAPTTCWLIITGTPP